MIGSRIEFFEMFRFGSTLMYSIVFDLCRFSMLARKDDRLGVYSVAEGVKSQ